MFVCTSRATYENLETGLLEIIINLTPLSLTGGTVDWDGRANRAVASNRTLQVSHGKSAVAVVPLGTVKAFRGTCVVHVFS